jgi:hypothetical protein
MIRAHEVFLSQPFILTQAACPQFFGYIVPFQGLRRDATHEFMRIRLSHIISFS